MGAALLPGAVHGNACARAPGLPACVLTSATPPVPLRRPPLQELLIYGKQFGNVFIGVQPTFGYEGDPMRLLFSKSASPHHGFAAYYTYLEKIFGADAVLHFGTHGSLEFMPGKQVRRLASADCLCMVRSTSALVVLLPSSMATCNFFVAPPVCDATIQASPGLRPPRQLTLSLPCSHRPPRPRPAGGHVWRVLPRLPDRHHPQPLLLRRQQPLGWVPPKGPRLVLAWSRVARVPHMCAVPPAARHHHCHSLNPAAVCCPRPPAEATIAKRRSYANTISYLTPPAENAGLYKVRQGWRLQDGVAVLGWGCASSARFRPAWRRALGAVARAAGLIPCPRMGVPGLLNRCTPADSARPAPCAPPPGPPSRRASRSSRS